jgi:HK97 family phage major capsid protein
MPETLIPELPATPDPDAPASASANLAVQRLAAGESAALAIPLHLDRAQSNGERLEIPVSIASEAIIDDPWLGPVKWSMDASAVDLSRASAHGIPVLEMHERDLPIGRVFGPRVENGRLIGTLRFSRSDKGQKIYADCVDGILTDTSVGAIITAVREESSHLVAIRWQPREVSLVDTGADPSVGVFRQQAAPAPVAPLEFSPAQLADIRLAVAEALPALQRASLEPHSAVAQSAMADHAASAVHTLTEQSIMSESPNKAAASAPDSASHVEMGVNRAAENTKAIMQLAEFVHQKHPEMGIMRLAEECATFERPFEEFRAQTWEMLRSHQAANPKIAAAQPDLGLSAKETRSFSIVRAALAQLTGDWKRAGFELECSRAIAEDLGKAPRGFFVPTEVQRQMGAQSLQRTQSVGDPTAGGFIVSQDYRGDLFVEALRAQSVAMMAGVRSMPGLVGNVTIPVQTGSATFGWIQEGVDGSSSALSFGAINMAPRTIAGAVPMTRRLLMQSSPAIEQLVRQDLITGAALALDDAILEGSGHSGVPLGISNHPSINTSTITSATTPDWDEMVEFETTVATDNALGGRLAFITTPAIRGILKTKSKDTGSGLFVLEGGEVNGYPVYVSTQLATSAILFGDWTQIMVGFWGVLDVKADESTLAASGGLVLRAFQDADVAIRHAVAFCKNV